MPSLPRSLCERWESPPTGSPKPAGPGAWNTFRPIPTSSSTARTIPAGARALARYLERFYAGRKMLDDLWRDARQGYRGDGAGILFPLADELVLTAAGYVTRACRPKLWRNSPGAGTTVRIWTPRWN